MALATVSDDRLRHVAGPLPEVHVWELDLAPRSTDGQRAGLDDMDARRISSLRRVDADRLLARRVLLRAAVAATSGCGPDVVAPTAGPGPRTVTAGDTGTWHVSSSSSGDRGLLALARVPVGIDIERLPGPPDAALVSRELLATPERAWIGTNGHDVPQRFLEVWVRKEAVVKCTGEGMSRDLRSFVVDASTSPAPVLTSRGAPMPIRTYALEVPGHAAALAVHAQRGS